MLSDVRMHGYLLQPLQPSNPAWPLEPSLVPRDPRSLPRLRDTAAAFPFVGSTSSKAKHVSKRQRHTHRHRDIYTEDTDTGGHRLPQPRCCHQQHPHRVPSTAPTSHEHRQTYPLLLWDWQRQEVTSASTHTHSPGSQAHAHLWVPQVQHSPSVSPAPLPGPWPSDQPHTYLLASWCSLILANTQHSHTHPMGTPYSQVSLSIKAWTAPAWTQGSPADWLVQLKVCWWMHKHTPAHQDWGRQRCSAAPSSQHQAHGLLILVPLQPLALTSLTLVSLSSWF